MMYNSEREARLAWSFLAEPGDADAGELVAVLGAAQALSAVRTGGTLPLREQGWRGAMARWTPRLAQIDVPDQMRRAERAQAHFLIPGDAGWPSRLDDLDVHAPVGVWVRGDAALLSRELAIALVGARAATGYGEHVVAELAAELGTRAVIVSGGAYGIDGAAHRAALATGAATVAVLAGGADRVYPAGHANLLAAIAEQGAVVSELPLGATPTRWRFLARNRLIAALSDATVVVEAGWRSGALNTAAHAASLGRVLGAVPGPVTSAASAGCHRLLREFDAVCVTSAGDVAELLTDTNVATPAASGGYATDPENRVLEVLRPRAAATTDAIAAKTGLSVSMTTAALGILVLRGRAVQEDDGWRLA